MKKTILVAILLFIAMVGVVSAVGLGVAPSVLDFKDVLRNREYERSIKIDNTASYPVNVTLSIVDYSDWFEFPEMVEVEGYNTRVPIKLKVPRRTPLGDYETMAYAMVYNQYGNFNYGVGFKIKFTVTNERIYCGYVDNIRTRDVIQGEPLKFIVGYANCGNIRHRVIMNINIQKQGEIVKRIRRSFRMLAYSQGTITKYYSRTNKLEKGQYTADVKVYMKQRKEMELLKERTVYFKVL